MPDPHFLYTVMAVVLTGLVGWVIAVNLWAPKRVPPPPRTDGLPPPPRTDGLPPAASGASPPNA